MASNNNSSNNNNEEDTTNAFQQQMDDLLRLVTNISQGQVNDDSLLEEAVSSLLSNNSQVANKKKMANKLDKNHANPLNTNTNTNKNTNGEDDMIVEDDDNYDDLDDTENGTSNKVHGGGGPGRQPPKWNGPKVSIETIEKGNQQMELNLKRNIKNSRRRKRCHDNDNIHDDNNHDDDESIASIDFNEKWNTLDDIPCGRIGARMMVTFGDNIDTDPNALSTALNGTRQCLQNAIKDARALKRKMKQDYDRAKVIVNLHRAKRKERTAGLTKEEIDVPLSGNVDPEMLFQAIGGYAKIGMESKCGFDDAQLEKLFPEEMHAYQRWRKMHKAYTDNSEDNKIAKQQQDKDDDNDEAREKSANDDDNDDELSKNEESKEKQWGGHLNDRLAQFDARTERMKEEWYMAFSVVRQGSFLSKSYATEDRHWEKTRKEKSGRGKRKTNWENLPASYVQFLHWVGFDHRSAIPPPNEETTEALAFLGYDFMGKIVEKAIFLRCLKKLDNDREEKNQNANIILELKKGEQLAKEDIGRALNESTVGAKPLYCATNSVLEQGSSVQLYFGPGFEDRIEMELEQ